MAFFRKTIANRKINKKIKEGAEVSALNLEKAKSVLVLFQLDICEEYVQAVKLMKDLKKKYPNITEVKAVGYSELKEIPTYFKEKENVILYQKNQVNWFFLPKKKEVELNKILNESPDILIDLSGNSIYPFRRLITEINSKFKVGLYSALNESFYDLMIKTQDGVRVLSEQAVHYLSLINKSK